MALATDSFASQVPAGSFRDFCGDRRVNSVISGVRNEGFGFRLKHIKGVVLCHVLPKSFPVWSLSESIRPIPPMLALSKLRNEVAHWA